MGSLRNCRGRLGAAVFVMTGVISGATWSSINNGLPSAIVGACTSYAPEDLVGKRFFEYIHPEDMAMFVAAFADSPKKVDALKADVELADIPVIMISVVDDRLVAEKLKESRAGRDIRVMGVMSHGFSGERCGRA